MNRAVSVAPGTTVKRSGCTPLLVQVSSRNDSLPISTAPAWFSTARIAARWVVQHGPTQCPSPPCTLTTHGTPVRRAASSAARPVG